MRSLVLFARRPILGQVKTRLSPALPAALATELYRALVDDALALLRTASADERWVYWAAKALDAPSPAVDAAAIAVPPGVLEAEQIGADLGESLQHAFDEILGAAGTAPEGVRHRAVIFGADCPWLDAAYVHAAFRALESADLVLGPALDGGYTLIGSTRPHPELFQGIEWGGADVLERTLARAKRIGLSHQLLDPLEDLDTPADLVRLIGRLAAPASAGAFESARHSRAAHTLERFGLLPPR